MKKEIFISLIILGILLLSCPVILLGQQVVANQEVLLRKYDNSDRIYTKLQIDTVVSYFYQRKIGEAIVEKDFIRYQFNINTEKLIEDSTQWREGLPINVEPVFTQEQAEAMVEGEVQYTSLYFISPNTDVFPVDPIPENPCWIVRSIDTNRFIVNIIDAMTGEKLGYGIPPPYEGFSQHGPDWGPCPQDPIWYDHAENARVWFNTMGYNTERVGNASDAKVQSHVQSDETAMFYELDHGGSSEYHNQCDSDITAVEIGTWIASYSSMVFTFLGSCDGMCDQTDNHFSFEFRKGSNHGTVAVGYCGMSSVACETNCWPNAIDWQTTMFTWMNSGSTVLTAFIQANLAYPDCSGVNNCMRFAGDASLTVVPVVTRSLCGSVYNGNGGPLNQNARRHYIRCNVNVPSGQTLTIGAGADLIFLNDSKIDADGTLEANGSTGQIRFVSENNENNGMEFIGEVEIKAGGEIKIHD